MKKIVLTFLICLSLSEVSLGQYVFTIADLQMLANAKSPEVLIEAMMMGGTPESSGLHIAP